MAGGFTWAHLNFGRRGRAPQHCRARRHDDEPTHGDLCRRMAAALCDAVVGPGDKTCDLPMCALHRTRAGERDYCPKHVAARARAFDFED